MTSFTNSCVSPRARSIKSGHKRLPVPQHHLPDHRRAPLARTQDVVQTPLLKRRDRRRRDHPPVRHHADATDPEARPQTVHDRQQNRAVSRVAGQHLRADRPALAVQNHRQHHLPKVRAVVLRVPVRAKRLTARAMERQRRGIHEHQRQVAEQVAAASEQTLLDVVLHAARRQTALAGRLQFLAQPRHRPIEMVKTQALDPVDGVVVHPF